MSDTGSGNEYGHSERRGGGGSDGDPHKTEGEYFVRLPGWHINPFFPVCFLPAAQRHGHKGGGVGDLGTFWSCWTPV